MSAKVDVIAVGAKVITVVRFDDDRAIFDAGEDLFVCEDHVLSIQEAQKYGEYESQSRDRRSAMGAASAPGSGEGFLQVVFWALKARFRGEAGISSVLL